MRKGAALVPGLALAAAGGLWVEARRVANAPLPRFGDLDPSGRYGVPGERHVRIVALGDSSLTGPGLFHPSMVWIARIAQRMERDVELVSVARGGARVRDVLRGQYLPALEHPADLYVVSVGANDAAHGTLARQYGRDLAELLDRLRSRAAVVSMGVGDLSMVPRIRASLRPLLSRRCAAIDRAHAEVTGERADVHRVPTAELSDPLFRAAGATLIAADLFHPNEEGHALWADLFAPWVRRALSGTPDDVSP